MIGLVESDGGVILPIKAQPGAKRNAILGERAGSIRVAVTAAPEAGKANEAIAKAAVARPVPASHRGRRAA